jgi:hypothetical protein
MGITYRMGYNILSAVWKVISGELLTEQGMEKKIYYIQKNMYILKLLLNVGTCVGV